MIKLAYVDPGTGSFAVQAVIGTVAGVSYATRHKLKAIAGKLRKTKPATKTNDK